MKRLYFLYCQNKEEAGGFYYVARSRKHAIKQGLHEILLDLCDEYIEIRCCFLPDYDVSLEKYGQIEADDLVRLGVLNPEDLEI